MKKVIKWGLWGLFALAIVLTFGYLWQSGQAKEVRYEILSPTEGDSIDQQIVLTGSIVPRDEVNIKPQISGIISEILVAPGDEVRVGDVIAKIMVVPEISQVNSAENNLSQARIAFERLQGVFKRDQTLYDKGLIAQEEYERSRAEYRNAEVQMNTAQQALEIIRKGTSARYSRESSTLVRATVSGKVLDVPVKVGSSVVQSNTFNDGTTIVTIANMQDLIFKGNADETEVGKLAVGQEMNISVGAIPDLKLRAKVEYISPQKSSTSTTSSTVFEVKGALELTPEVSTRLRSGYSANANIYTARASHVLSIPEAALSYRGDSAYVHVVLGEDPLTTEERQVTLGLSDGRKVEVKSGLKAGERIRGSQIFN